jgi:hypothetical protein
MAYRAGAGSLVLIIGSVAGVAAIGWKKNDFFWYVKCNSGLAMIGYLAGVFFYILEMRLFEH